MSDGLVNKDKVTISDFWLKGAVNRYPGYTFQAKVYDFGNVFGIEQGRISKLQVWRDDRTVTHYDRGWDESPAIRHDRKVLREILAGFPDQRREQVKDDVAAAKREPRRGFAFSWNRARTDGDFER